MYALIFMTHMDSRCVYIVNKQALQGSDLRERILSNTRPLLNVLLPSTILIINLTVRSCLLFFNILIRAII